LQDPLLHDAARTRNHDRRSLIRYIGSLSDQTKGTSLRLSLLKNDVLHLSRILRHTLWRSNLDDFRIRCV